MSKRRMMKIRYRFPKFHLDWKEDEFKGIFDFHQTNTFSRSQMNNRRGFARNIHYGDILTKYGNILSNLQEVPYINKDISLLKVKEESYLQNGDIIIADTAEDLTVGKAMEVQNIDGKILSGLHTILCRPKFKFAPRFLGYNLNSSSYRRNLIPLVVGVKVCSISKTNISKTLVMYPDDINEQQKIADCLSSIDDLISAEEKKLSLLNDYKKGWMQKLFPTEGKTVPEWRFPEFKDRGEWTSDLIANVISTIRPPKKLSTFEYKMIGRYPIVDQGQDEFCGWTDERSSLVDFDNKVLIFGDHTCVVKLVDRPFAQGADGIKIISTKKKISVDFLFQYLCNSPIISISYKRHFSELKEKTILFPDLDSGEQEKISRFLFSIDILIKKEKNKITELKQHKKALMQGLFPTVEEVL